MAPKGNFCGNLSKNPCDIESCNCKGIFVFNFKQNGTTCSFQNVQFVLFLFILDSTICSFSSFNLNKMDVTAFINKIHV